MFSATLFQVAPARVSEYHKAIATDDLPDVCKTAQLDARLLEPKKKPADFLVRSDNE